MPTTTPARSALRLATIALTVSLGIAMSACSGSDDNTTEAAQTEAVATEAVETEAPADDATATEAAAGTGLSGACAKDQLALRTAGKLTIGTDKPAYSPWFADDDPTNAKGFESAVAYAVAETLGFSHDEVVWQTVPFDKSFAPGKKDFDFDINQISITPERQAVVDFSDGYYEVNQAVVAVKGSKAASAMTIADLKQLKFGVQVATTSLDFVTSVVAPDAEPFVYNNTNDAKAALAANQIDAIVVDLPTGFYIAAAEIDNGVVVGQFASQGGGEQFGLLLEKGSALTGCVNEALAALKSSGRLAEIQDAELSKATSAPVFE